MHLVFLANPDSIHTKRWADGLRARGQRVDIVANNEGRRRGLPKMVYWLRQQVFLRRLLRRERTAVLVVHSVPTGLRALALLGLHPRIAVAWGSEVYFAQSEANRRSLRSRLQAALLRGSDGLMSPSRDLGAPMEAAAGRPCTLIPLGVEADRFSPQHRNPDDTVVFGFAKDLKPIYGPDVLLHALAMARTAAGAPPLRLRLGGAGPFGAELRNLTQRLGLTDLVEFVGAIAHADMPAFLRSLDVYVMPSRSEAFGVGALEAAACELPVVATSVGGIPEIVVDGATGILVPPDDPAALAAAMRRLAGDRALRKAMGEAGRRRVSEAFRWADSLTSFEALAASVTGAAAVTR